jgi:hypothetical protein
MNENKISEILTGENFSSHVFGRSFLFFLHVLFTCESNYIFANLIYKLYNSKNSEILMGRVTIKFF